MAVAVVIRSAEEAHRLLEFSLRVAGALDEELEVWLASTNEDHFEEAGKKGEWEEPGVDLVRDLSGVNRRRKVLESASSSWPSLLIVGTNHEAKSDDPDRKFSSDLFDQVKCQILALRICVELGAPGQRILVPCAGGSHSRRALKLANALFDGGAVAFQVRPDDDDLSSEVGVKHLESIVRKAGLKTENVLCRVRLGDDFREGLSKELEDENYGLVIIGASGAGALRRKLFGTLPEKTLRCDDGITVGVLRAERSRGHRVRETVGRLIHVTVPQLNRLERIQLFSEVESKSRWNFDFAALMALATSIAGMGLLVNSGAVVIGAMLVAPLMMPLIGTGLSLVQGNWPLCRRAVNAVARGFFLALLLGLGMGLLARFLELGLTDQLRMRGEPNALDLGIAFVSGIAASYCVARPKLSGALAGVAIAAALVPPIATVGIGLAMGETSVGLGAALLFGTNIVAIVLGAGLNFMLAGIRGKHRDGEWGRRGLIALLLICIGLSVPLTSGLLSRLSRSGEVSSAVEKKLPEGVRLVSVSHKQGGGLEITIESATPVGPELVRELQEVVENTEGKKTPIKLRTHLVQEEP